MRGVDEMQWDVLCNYAQTEDKRANNLCLFSLARDVTCLLTRRGVALVYNAVNRDRRCFFFLFAPPSSHPFLLFIFSCRRILSWGGYYRSVLLATHMFYATGYAKCFFPSLFSLQRSFLAGMIRF